MTRLLALCLLALFVFALYLQMATASLYERYQPGIAVVRWISPHLLLVALLLPLPFLRPDRAKCWFDVVLLVVKGGFVVVLLAVALWFALDLLEVAAGTWQPPENRSLSSTLKIALLQPQFSNRSLGTVIGTFVSLVLIAAGMRVVCLYRNKGRAS